MLPEGGTRGAAHGGRGEPHQPSAHARLPRGRADADDRREVRWTSSRRRPPARRPGLADVVDLSDALTLAALPTAYLLKIEITAANRVVVHVPRAEVGQGITTAMGIIAAEELDARLDAVDVVLDDARPELLWNQLTGGSNSVHALYTPMRTVAAAARARLVTAAAQRFGVAAASLDHARLDGRRARRAHRDVRIAVGRGGAGHGAGGRRRPRSRPSRFTRIGQPTTAPRRAGHRDRRGRSTRSTSTCRARPTVVARPPTIGGTRAVGRTTRSARAMPGVAGRRPHPERRRGRRDDLRPGRRRPATRCRSPGTRARTRRSPTPQIRTRLQAAALPFVVPPLGMLVDRPELRLRVRPARTARGADLRRRRPRRSGRDLVRREEPDRRQPEGRRGGRPPGRARSPCTSSGPADRSATGCSSSPRSRPPRCRRRSAGRSS